MISYEWESFKPTGGIFKATSSAGHVLAAFLTGEEAWASSLTQGHKQRAKCYRSYALVGLIDEIMVKRASRRKGEGSKLLLAVLDKFRELGIRDVFLRVQPERPEWLVDLLRFYWRFGFEIAKECIDEGDSILTMKTTLD